MNRHPRRFGQSGFSLLEIMITLVIIAVGLMGFAGMMVKSAANNRTAMQRSLATMYAYDIIDCMRVNRTAAISNLSAYTRDFEDDVPSGATVADVDVQNWLGELSTALPSGQGQITFTGTTVTVEIRWTDVGVVEVDEEAEDEEDKLTGNVVHTWKTESTL
jgi:type IV pilus assembly protein PilV